MGKKRRNVLDKHQYVCINLTDINIRKGIVKSLSYCILYMQTSVTRIQYIRSMNLKMNKIYLKYAFYLVHIKKISSKGMPELISSKASVDHVILQQWRIQIYILRYRSWITIFQRNINIHWIEIFWTDKLFLVFILYRNDLKQIWIAFEWGQQFIARYKNGMIHRW